MYIEFIIIFILLGVIAVLLLAACVLLIVLLAKVSKGGPSRSFRPTASAAPGAVVFCKKCGQSIDATMRVCPHCGTVR